VDAARTCEDGIRDARQIIINGKYADMSVRDLSTVVDASVEPTGVVEVQEELYLRTKKN
jgi:hypothetical protein